MVYYLGRDVRVGISTEQANYGIKHASGAITISNTSSTSGDLGGAYADPDFIPRRAGVAEVSTITFVSAYAVDYESLASNNQYVLLYDENGKKYLVWWDHDTTGAKPTGLDEDYDQEIDIQGITAHPDAVRAATGTQLAADSDFAAAFTFSASGAILTITNKDTGAATDLVRGSGFSNSDLTVATSTEGTGGDASVSLSGYDELRVDDITNVDFTFGALDEEIVYMGQRTALKTEIKKEISITITRKKSDNSFSKLFEKARCGIIATTGVTALAGGADTVAFDNSSDQPFADSFGSGFGYRVFLELKSGVEVLTLSNCCITEYSVSVDSDAVQEETITFYSNVLPVILTGMNITTTASTAL